RAGQPVQSEPGLLPQVVEPEILLQADLRLGAEIGVHPGEDDDDPMALMDCVLDETGEVRSLPRLDVADDEALAAIADCLRVRAPMQDPLRGVVDRSDGGLGKAGLEPGSVARPFSDSGLRSAVPIGPAAILSDHGPHADPFDTVAGVVEVRLVRIAEAGEHHLDACDALLACYVLIEVSGAGSEHPFEGAVRLPELSVVHRHRRHICLPPLRIYLYWSRLARAADIWRKFSIPSRHL